MRVYIKVYVPNIDKSLIEMFSSKLQQDSIDHFH